jgi:lysozyme
MSKQFRRITETGVNMIRAFEQVRLTAYLDAVGVWTIGYGATGPEISKGVVWTRERAERRFLVDLRRFEQGVADVLCVQVNDDQFAALVSFAYNVGLGALRDSTLIALLNDGDWLGASMQFLKWTKGHDPVSKQLVVLPGLVRRRELEMALFLRGSTPREVV